MSDTVAVARLILDETVWPRHQLMAANLAAIVEALKAGEALPPVIADRKTRVVTDGWHRIEAYKRVFDETHEIPVEFRTYRDKAAMLGDAVALNVGRGADLSRWDIARCTLLAEEAGLPLDTLAKLLHWRPERLAAYRDSRMGKTVDDRKIALKRSIRQRMNQPLTPAQETANQHLSGMQPMFHVNQLITLIETDLLPTDAALWDRLHHLAHLIETNGPAEEKGA